MPPIISFLGLIFVLKVSKALFSTFAIGENAQQRFARDFRYR